MVKMKKLRKNLRAARKILSQEIKKSKLKPGDHIYSWRKFRFYCHHGIYMGGGKVIHFTRGAGEELGTGSAELERIILSSSPTTSDIPCPKCGYQSNCSGVISSCIDCFRSGGSVYLYQYSVSRTFFCAKIRGGTCTFADSDPPADVLHRATYLLENGFGVYHISRNNCEDFALYCKTELVREDKSKGRSGQVESIKAARKAIVSECSFTRASFFVRPFVAGRTYCRGRFERDIGNRRDAVRVPVEELVALSVGNGYVRVPVEELVARCAGNGSVVTMEEQDADSGENPICCDDEAMEMMMMMICIGLLFYILLTC